MNAIRDYDYEILMDSILLDKKLQQFKKLMQTLNNDKNSPVSNELLNKTLGECSGDRLFYIVGCYLV